MVGADHDVLEGRQMREQPHALRGPRYAEPDKLVRLHPPKVAPAPASSPAVRAHKAADDIEECRLAGPVRADHADDPPGRNVEADVVECAEALEMDADTLDPQLTGSLGPGRRNEPGFLRARDQGALDLVRWHCLPPRAWDCTPTPRQGLIGTAPETSRVREGSNLDIRSVSMGEHVAAGHHHPAS